MNHLKALGFIFFLSFSSQAFSNVMLDYTVSNAVFNDGGTLSGTFVFDLNQNFITSYALATTPGTQLQVNYGYYTFNPRTIEQAGSANNLTLFNKNLYGNPTFFSEIQISFASSLANGGTIAITGGEASYPQSNPIVTGNYNYLAVNRTLISGEVTAPLASPVPLPPSIGMFLTGLLILSSLRKKLLR
jgi:hypothetical protein